MKATEGKRTAAIAGLCSDHGEKEWCLSQGCSEAGQVPGQGDERHA